LTLRSFVRRFFSPALVIPPKPRFPYAPQALLRIPPVPPNGCRPLAQLALSWAPPSWSRKLFFLLFDIRSPRLGHRVPTHTFILMMMRTTSGHSRADEPDVFFTFPWTIQVTFFCRFRLITQERPGLSSVKDTSGTPVLKFFRYNLPLPLPQCGYQPTCSFSDFWISLPDSLNPWVFF